VFEHISDVSRAVLEMKRVMKKGAITYIIIHLFTSLSGRHNIPIIKSTNGILPNHIFHWDHLRKSPLLPIPPDLNKLREYEFKEIFNWHFEILEWICPDYMHEQKKLLKKKLKKSGPNTLRMNY